MRTTLLSAMAVGLLAGLASADVVSFSGSAPNQATDSSSLVSIQKFDASLGTLDKVEWTLDAFASGRVRVENLDSAPVVSLLTLDVSVSLARPDNSSLLTVSKSLLNVNHSLTANDNDLDYAGSSGATFDQLAASDNANGSSTAASDLLLFTGVGNIDLSVARTGLSTTTGLGNAIFIPESWAGARVTVTYHYTVPAAGTMVPMAAGLLALGRRRRAA